MFINSHFNPPSKNSMFFIFFLVGSIVASMTSFSFLEGLDHYYSGRPDGRPVGLLENKANSASWGLTELGKTSEIGTNK